MVGLRRKMAVTALALAATGISSAGHPQGDAADPCTQTTEAAERSCVTAARSDNWLALAKCFNLPPAARKACRQQAAADLADAIDLCDEQDDARDEVCSRLGGGRYDPMITRAQFVAQIDNPYFPLTPGTTFVYEGQTADGFEHDEFAVTHNTKVILDVTCTEVHDLVTLDGKLIEDTLDWFAQDVSGNVWYFGENSKQLADGLVIGIEGSWIGGEDGAKPGIIMKAHPAMGDFYRQEFSINNAEDLAEVLSLNEMVTVPYGSFSNCLKTGETSPLEPEVLEFKFYAAGVGNLLTVDSTSGERSELVAITH